MTVSTLLLALVLQPVSAQVPRIEAGFRPAEVRVGGRVILTVQVEGPGIGSPTIDLVHAPDVDLLDVVDRARAGRWERDFVLVPTGPAQDDWIVEVTFGTEVFVHEIAPPVVHVVAGWIRPDRPPRDDVRNATGAAGPERAGAGVPETGSSGVAGQPFAPSGGLAGALPGWAYGGGWATNAHQDPWWAELVPEVLAYDAATADPSTGVSLEAGLARRRVYVGQQVTLLATVSVPPGEVPHRPRYWAPSPRSFTRVPLGAQGHATVQQGELEYGATFQSAYFPLQPGEWAFPSGGIHQPGREALAGPPIGLTVMPVPQADAPEGYSGAVGRFQLSAGVEPVDLRWGQSAILWIEVRGVGDIRHLPPPVPPRVYGARPTPYRDRVFLESRDGVAGGVKSFLYLLTPTELGPVEIDPIIYPYFDPYLEGFAALGSGPMTLEVRP